jgi:uncharacterized membrane protein
MMNIRGEIVFKILYPFIFSLVPLTIYRVCEKQFGKLIGLLSAFSFTFTSVAFFGAESLSLNRQIVAELFILLSVFILINKTISVTKRRLLLIIFGAALVTSHYSLAYIYLFIVALVFLISKVKQGFDGTLNTATVLSLFVFTFVWYSIGPSSALISLINTIQGTFVELTTGLLPASAATASNMYAVPQIFTVASLINLLVNGIANLLLIIGALVITLRPKKTGIFEQYRLFSILAAIILAVSLVVPNVATILNFSRIYGISILFLSPCLVFGGQTLLTTIGKAWTKIKRPLKCQNYIKNNNINRVFLLIAILLSAYFLSQAGFINRITNGSLNNYYPLNFETMKTSNETQVKISLYNSYIPEQDVCSASWLSNHKVETSVVFSDTLSGSHVLLSYGLIPNKLVLPITNTTIPPRGSFIYLGSLNIVNSIVTTASGSFNISEIASQRYQENLVYSNGNSEISYLAVDQ